MEDLLPGAENGLPFTHRHCQARTEQRRLQVGMAIAVVPGLLVGIVPAGWNQPPQKRGQVLLQARLELDGAYRSGAAHVEDLDDARAHTRLADNSGDRAGQVVHLTATGGVQRQFLLKNHANIIVRRPDDAKPPERRGGLQNAKFRPGATLSMAAHSLPTG